MALQSLSGGAYANTNAKEDGMAPPHHTSHARFSLPPTDVIDCGHCVTVVTGGIAITIRRRLRQRQAGPHCITHPMCASLLCCLLNRTAAVFVNHLPRCSCIFRISHRHTGGIAITVRRRLRQRRAGGWHDLTASRIRILLLMPPVNCECTI